MEQKDDNRYVVISYACAAIVTTVLYIIAGHYFKFYYDLNDDILIKDILSGAYTGRPDAHNIQMLYPLAWLFKLLYGVAPHIPWFGMLEIGFMWMCMILMLSRTQLILMNNIENRFWRVMAIIGLYLCETSFGVATQFWEFFMIQYTVVCGMLASTAAFLLFTKEKFEVSDNLIPIILILLAFNLRSEMLLLMCPFLAVVGVCKWISEEPSLQSLKKYLIFLGILICGAVLSLVINSFAYKASEWQDFNRLFKARTTVYDFTGIPDYDANTALYDSLLMDRGDYERLADYNYVLSYAVNPVSMEKIADYATEHNLKKKTAAYAIFEVLMNTAQWKTPAQKEALNDPESVFLEEGVKLHVPSNMIIIVLYILAIIAAVYAKDIKWAYTLPFLIIMRSISWGYVSYKDRINARIAHPLYLMECAILVGVLLVAWAESNYSSPVIRKRISILLTVVFVVAGIINAMFTPAAVKDVKHKAELREIKNREADLLYAYTSENPRTYYLLDVYSTVDYTEQIFTEDVHKKGNTQLAGGWAALSPLDTYKQSFYEDIDSWQFITSTEREGLISKDTICDNNGETVFYVYNVKDVR